MNKKKFSIIVATHNDGEYLKECIESVLKQFYFNFELIIVDDGSTDDTREICKKYVEQDKRVSVISQECQGPLIARKNGLKVASGDYIYMIDADDYISPRLLSDMIPYLENTEIDMVMFQIETFGISEKNIITLPLEPRCQLSRELIIDMVLTTTNHSLANKIFKKEIISLVDTDYERYKNVRLGLDKIQLFPFLCKIRCGMYIDEVYYFYRIKEKSISHNCNPRAAYDIGFSAEQSILVLERNGLLTEKREQQCYINYLKSMAPRMVNLLRVDDLYKEKKKHLVEIQKSNIYIKAGKYETKQLLGLYNYFCLKCVRNGMGLFLHIYYRIRRA